MIDLTSGLTISVIIAALFITANKPVAWLLLAEYCTFIGFDMLVSAFELEEALWVDPFCGLLSIVFMLGFSIMGAQYLAAVSALIAIYYVAVFTALTAAYDGHVVYYNLIIDFDYGVMLALGLLQLFGLLPGVIRGIRRFNGRDIAHRRGFPWHFRAYRAN